MNNFDKNETIIQTLRRNSDQFYDLQIVGTNLLFRGAIIDLNKIDLETIIRDIDGEITPDKLFKALENTKEEKDNVNKWEIIKKENPDMKSITIFYNHNLELNKQEEFINIKTSDGKNHLFKNVIGLDIFKEYMKLKAIYGDSISPEILARSIEKWQLNELAVTPADEVIADPRINENIKNQVQEYINQYKDKNYINITVNPEADVIYINDELNPENSFIVTFTKDINNELVAVEHNNNVSSETTTKEEKNESIESESDVKNNISDSNRAAYNTDYQNTENVLSDDDFSRIVSQGNFSVEDIEKINKFLENTQKMIDAHTPNIETTLKNIEGAVTTLQLMKDFLNRDEKMVVAKCNALLETYNKSMGFDNGQVLTYNNPNLPKTGEEDGNFGYLNIVSIFITISAVLIGLSIFLLHILS